MVNIRKHIEYWRNGAVDEWETTEGLLGLRKTRQALFFAHLAIEKALKAHICRITDELAPRSHNLVRLAEVAGLDLDDAALDLLADMNAFNLEGRYPDTLGRPPGVDEAQDQLTRAEKVFQWLIVNL